MTKLWLMVAIVALVLSAVQCAKEDDVGLDTREFMQARILTANQKRIVRKYLPNMFNTSAEGHHTYGHNRFNPRIFELRFAMHVLQMLAHRGSVRSLQVHEVWKVSANRER